MSYPFQDFEKKWQNKWDEEKCFEAMTGSPKKKFYALNMFPYPSGLGLHMGHLASYTPTDIVARYKRACGFNVLQPMGYDAFGLPAEQFAIKTGLHPSKAIQEAIKGFRKLLKTMGYSYDWSREVATSDPGFYKGTQSIFLKLYEKGLAYQKEVPVNWCPELRTVLANDEVIDGKSERGGHPVVRKKMKQWLLKITDYAERLLDDLDDLDWPESTKASQREWIGKSIGAVVNFPVSGFEDSLKIEAFTTRPDTLFGVSFMVLAPEHPLVANITTPEQKSEVDQYIIQTSQKSELARKAETDKTGVFTGGYAINPASQKPVPVWIADYVLPDYGSGAIMAVPGHDVRDFEFAQKFELSILRVLESEEELPFAGEGTLVNSDFLNGLSKSQAIDKMIQYLEENKIGKKEIQYKLRDWLFSRQRFWGEPFPIVHFPNGETSALSEEELPVLLPDVADFEPTEDGEAPLSRNKEFLNYVDPITGKKGLRETDTMPGSAGSSWYFLKYTDPFNPSGLFDFEAQKYWMPVDFYLGGTEHKVGHLLYARFWQKVLFDLGLVSHDEPFKKLVHQGVIMGTDGTRMSKSRGNVVNPNEVIDVYGVDVARIYVIFMGPFDKDKPWSSHGIDGIKRFLERIWRLCLNDDNECIAEDSVEIPTSLNQLLHKTIKKVTEDLDTLNLNTPISALMILVNEIYKLNIRPKSMLKIIAQLLMPYAPHISEELWYQLGGEGLVSTSPWPTYDSKLTVENTATIGVQVNGKMRGTLELEITEKESVAQEQALQITAVKKQLGNKNLVKVIYRPGKILNLIVK